jgi:toxin HigB-1
LAATDILNFRHKGMKRLFETGDASGLSPEFVKKIRNILAFLDEMESEDELKTIPAWRAHKLSGDRKGVRSLSVSRNWRVTFCIEETVIVDLDDEDYH